MSLSIYCRIRPPNQLEILTSPQRFQTIKRDTSRSPMRTPKTAKPSSLSKDFMYSIFTCSNSKSPQIVICSENPIQGKLIEANIKSEEDITSYQESILQNTRTYKFDKIFSHNSTQNTIFADVCKQNVNNLLKGISSNIFVYGPNGGGKKYTFRGSENKESGIVIQSIDFLLNLLEISKQSSPSPLRNKDNSFNSSLNINTSIITVNEDSVFDLLVPKGRKLSMIDDSSYHSIRFLSEFKNLYRLATSNLKNIDSGNFKTKSHLIIRIVLSKNEFKNDLFSQICFIKFADSDNNELKTDFQTIGKFFKNISLNRKNKIESDGNLLLKILKSNQSENITNSLICCVSSNSQLYPQSLHSLKFCSSIREVRDDKSNFEPKEKELFLCEEIDRNYKQIFNFTQIAKEYNYQECLDWLNDKEYSLFALEKEIMNFGKTKKSDLLSKKLIIFHEMREFLKSIKEKAISKGSNFINMVSQYHKKLDNLKTPETNPMLEIEKDLYTLKSNIMKKIDEAISHSPRHKPNQSIESLKEIKILMQEKESLERESVIHLKEKNQKLENLVEKLEKKQENKDPNQFPNSKELIFEKFKMKLAKKELKISKLKEDLKIKELKNSEENKEIRKILRDLEEENKKLREILEDKSGIDSLYRNQNSVINDLKERIQKELEHKEVLKNDNEKLLQKNEELKNNFQNLELKINKLKEKSEKEKKNILNETKKDISVEKDGFLKKIESLNNVIQQLQEEIIFYKDKILKYEEKVESFEKNQQNYSEEIEFLKSELERTRRIKQEISEDANENHEKANFLEQNSRNLLKEIEKLKEEKLTLDEIISKDREISNNIEQKNFDLIEESKNQREYIIKLEIQLEYLKTQQHYEFDELEKKLEEYLIDNKTIYEENERLKCLENELKNEIKFLSKEQIKNFQEKESLITKNDQLNLLLQNLEIKVKNFINEKKGQIKEINRTESLSMQPYESTLLEKLKILEDIQSAIKQQNSPKKY